MTWQDFIYRARALGYPSAKDPDGIEIVGIPGGYVAPAGNGCEVVTRATSTLHDLPRDVATFMRRIAESNESGCDDAP